MVRMLLLLGRCTHLHFYPAGPAGPYVAGGPVGPDDCLPTLESCEHLVLDHADPVGQHDADLDTVEPLEYAVVVEYSLRLLEANLDSGLVKNISDWEPEASPVPDATLDSRLTEGITNLEHSAPGVSLDSGPMLCLEPSEQSVPNSSLIVRPVGCVTENILDWKPLMNPAISYTLDSRPMKGITNLERSALGVPRNSRPTEGAPCLEPLEQSVLSSSLAARPVEGVAEKVSDRKPVINPVQDSTPDGQPMEGTTYLEHLALGVSLDSRLREGMSHTEKLEQSVLGEGSIVRICQSAITNRHVLNCRRGRR